MFTVYVVWHGGLWLRHLTVDKEVMGSPPLQFHVMTLGKMLAKHVPVSQIVLGTGTQVPKSVPGPEYPFYYPVPGSKSLSELQKDMLVFFSKNLSLLSSSAAE